MTRITTREFYAASRERLTVITSDEALLAAFDLQAEYDLAGHRQSDDRELVERWDTALGDFLAEMMRWHISLDYIFGGKGKPFTSPGFAPGCENFISDYVRLPEELKSVFADFIAALANYERKKKITDYKPAKEGAA